MRVLIGGASGLLGTALRDALTERGDEVVALVRREAGPGEISWDPGAGRLDPGAIEGFDAVVNLGGVSIGADRWNEERRELLRSSRIDTTRLLSATIAGLDEKPGVLVSGSAIGYYGDRGDEDLDESSDPGDMFISRLAVDWEGATQPAVNAGVRVVLVRTGIVLDADGGALERMLLPFKTGVGGRLGDGQAWWSWISITDWVGGVLHVIDGDHTGPVNLTAPSPVRSEEFTDTLAKVLRRPTILPTPRFALDLLLGKELAESLLFTSAKVHPTQLIDTGYRFTHPTLEPALRTILS